MERIGREGELGVGGGAAPLRMSKAQPPMYLRMSALKETGKGAEETVMRT